MHAPKYPILAGMARDVLPVTASTVAAASVWVGESSLTIS